MKRLLHPLYKAYCKLLQICVSRKFLVLFTATYLLQQHLLSGMEFVPIALGVLGIQGYLDSKSPAKNFEDNSNDNLPGL